MPVKQTSSSAHQVQPNHDPKLSLQEPPGDPQTHPSADPNSSILNISSKPLHPLQLHNKPPSITRKPLHGLHLYQ